MADGQPQPEIQNDHQDESRAPTHIPGTPPTMENLTLLVQTLIQRLDRVEAPTLQNGGQIQLAAPGAVNAGNGGIQLVGAGVSGNGSTQGQADRTPRVLPSPPPHIQIPVTDLPPRVLFASQPPPNPVQDSDLAARMTRMEEMFSFRSLLQSNLPNPQIRLSPWENAILKKITDMPDFTGEDKTTWSEYEKAFTSKAALIAALPKSEWVNLIHSHVAGAALDYAKANGLVQDDILVPCSFADYSAVMSGAMFGESMTLAGKFMALLSVTQTGVSADPVVFLREKEKYLNMIPLKELGPNLRAACALVGMDTTLQKEIQAHCKPKAHQSEVAFSSFEEVRSAVIAVVSFQNDLVFHSNKTKRAAEAPLPQASYRRSDNRQQSPSTSYRRPSSPFPDRYRSTPPTSPGRSDESVRCVDCGQQGHSHRGFHWCPKNARHHGGQPSSTSPSRPSQPPSPRPDKFPHSTSSK